MESNSAAKRLERARKRPQVIEDYLHRIEDLKALLANAADALHDAAWIMGGAKTEPPLPPPVTLVLPQTERVEGEIRDYLQALS